jgi:hypothetical protein
MDDFVHVSVFGGLIAFVGGVVAQVDPNGQAGQAGWITAALGITTALIAGLGTIAKSFADYKKQRDDADITKLRITMGNDRLRRYHMETREYLARLAEYIAKIPGAPPGIPEPPTGPEHRPHHDVPPSLYAGIIPDEPHDD